MLSFHFSGDTENVSSGIGELSGLLQIAEAEDGIQVHLKNRDGDIRVSWDGNQSAALEYSRPNHFFRALGLLVENIKRGAAFEKIETPAFSTLGVMVDASRNAVMKPQSIKKLLRVLALMGYDTLTMYTEDTYEIPGQPFFGYGRGRYSFDELKECDDYAALFGIEMMPCIQTLGHLAAMLKWSEYSSVKDTGDILLVGSEKTYALLDEMIRAAAAPYRSQKIHIGMDEAHSIGLGKYLDQNGFGNRFELMTNHLDRVLQITRRHNLEPMIWSDMYFRLGSKTGDYYADDSVIPKEIIPTLPADVKLVYWDYYHTDKEFYSEWIRRHKVVGKPPVYAAGMWTWIGHGVFPGASEASFIPALEACKEEGVTEAITTLWGDDGNEANIFGALAQLQHFAELGFANSVDASTLQSRFAACAGGDYEAFNALRWMDETPGTALGNTWPEIANPSKYCLYQDPLIGLFDKNIEPHNLAAHYKKLAPQLKELARKENDWSDVFDVAASLCRVLELKAELSLNMKKFYAQNDKAGLKKISSHQIPAIIERVENLRITHRAQWFATYKPFGWEVIDIRYGGLKARLESAAWRIEEYLSGAIETLEELEKINLFFDSLEKPAYLGLFHRHRRIVTAGVFA